MAILNPAIDVIKRQKVQPTKGEWALLNFLMQNLDDTYDIYFQPFLNGDNPDLAVMRKGSGLLLIEVKDWNLEHYRVDDSTNWQLAKDGTPIKSPLKQVENYKSNLFNLHSEELFKKNIENKNHWATVNCAIYFHNESEEKLRQFLTSKFDPKKYKDYHRFLSYFGLLGHDSLNEQCLTSLLTKFWMNKRSYYFDNELYDSLHRYLQAPVHQVEDGISIIYTKEQHELIKSEARPRRKIKGAAGCGKTLVLAKRAVNAYLRTKNQVLVLTYNLSLKNYIHDRINDVREMFPWNNFYITNYHQFFKAQANNHNLEIHSIEDWQNTNFFKPVKEHIHRYDVILIDEIQDYRQEWIDIVCSYFMHENTEFVVFGDEKQNIYERPLDSNNEPIVRTVTGQWNRSLNTSHRFASNIGTIAMKFQKSIFGKKYSSDEINFLSQIDFDKRVVEYYNFHSPNISKLFDTIFSIIVKHKIHPSDVGILCSKVEMLRELDFLVRTVKHENTTTTFESQEEYERIKEKGKKTLIEKGIPENELNLHLYKQIIGELEEIRKVKKYHFWMKTGTMKLSTVHSFKGWEIDTLFLFIENEQDSSENAELIYTGLTRARRNLFVFNFGNLIYDSFFQETIEVKHELA
jgi:hypothetical protein